MTAFSAAVPRVRVVCDGNTYGLAAGVHAAVGMLAEARRVEVVGRDDRADVVHTIGVLGASVSSGAHHVHSVACVPVRAGHLALAPFSVRRERHRLANATWLAHGQTTGRILLEAGIAAGSQLRCVPLLHPPFTMSAVNRPAARAQARERLGVGPGVRLVMSLDPAAGGGGEHGWVRVLRGSGRTDVAVLQARPVGVEANSYLVRCDASAAVEATMGLSELLAACDIFVACANELRACAPAVAAADWGIPIVATTTDSVAELVLHSGRGLVVAPGTDRVAAALLRQLEEDPRGAAAPCPPDPTRRVADFAHALLSGYRGVFRSGLGGAA